MAMAWMAYLKGISLFYGSGIEKAFYQELPCTFSVITMGRTLREHTV